MNFVPRSGNTNNKIGIGNGRSKVIIVVNEYSADCDTDSIFVKPDTVKDIQDFFKPLNPYSLPVEMFKIEEDDNHKPLDNVMFYGISAKRYCLFDMNEGKINIRKYSTHGLGHLLNINGKDVWKAILTGDFSEFTNKIAVSQITISKPLILNRFKKMNANKPFNKKIKPFNFMRIGSEKNGIIPCLPFSKDIRGIQYKPFIDYKSDTTSDKLPLPLYEYWYSLEDVFTKYVIHNDNKFNYNNEGIAHRKHIIVNRIRYIGKESNNLDEASVLGIDDQSYLEYVNLDEFKQWVLSLMPLDVIDWKISKKGLERTQVKIKLKKPLNPKTKTVKILLKLYKGLKLDKTT